MANRKPLALVGGTLQEIGAPDLIDPAILPASGSVPVTVSADYAVPANAQVFARLMVIDATHNVLVPANSELIFA